MEFDDTQSQAVESDEDYWSDEELNINQTKQLQLPAKTQEDVVIENLRQWASSTQVPYIHVSSLLKVLHKDAGLTYLPLDSRTLLKSLRGKLLFEDMPPGKYRHFDLEASYRRRCRANISAARQQNSS